MCIIIIILLDLNQYGNSLYDIIKYDYCPRRTIIYHEYILYYTIIIYVYIYIYISLYYK